MNMWEIVLRNDTGPNDDYYQEWWEVSEINGLRLFDTDCEDDAKWLCNLLNDYERAKSPLEDFGCE